MITFKLPDDWYMYYPEVHEEDCVNSRYRTSLYGFVPNKIPVVAEFNGHMVLRNEQMILQSSTGTKPEISFPVMIPHIAFENAEDAALFKLTHL
jgi:hypothetical protein